MADKRAFAVFDVGYLDNPKIQDILDAGPYAVLMHSASIMYCAQHLTDGQVAAGHMQRKVGGTAADTTLLVERGLWHRPGHDCEHCPDPDEGKVYVHDYTEHNRTSDGVKRASRAGKKGAEALWEKRRKAKEADADRMRNASEPQSEPQCDEEEIAMARQTDRQTDEEAKASSQEIPRPDIDGVIQGFSELLKANDVKHKPGASWRTAARLLIDKDGYTPEQIMYVARFATADEFWKSNILSMVKLREKFEALKLKAQAQHQQVQGRPTGSQVRLQAGLELIQRTQARQQERQAPYQAEIED